MLWCDRPDADGNMIRFDNQKDNDFLDCNKLNHEKLNHDGRGHRAARRSDMKEKKQ